MPVRIRGYRSIRGNRSGVDAERASIIRFFLFLNKAAGSDGRDLLNDSVSLAFRDRH